MDICRRSNIGFQNNLIIEEMLTTDYFQNNNEQKYLDDIQKFIDDMKPYNKLLKENKIIKNEYLKILNKRKTKLIY